MKQKSVATNSKLSKEWHSKKNKNLTPKDVTLGSGKKVWWVCEKGHEWQAIIAKRNDGRNCPYCAGKKVDKLNCLATLNPKLAKEWHSKKNKNLTPKDVNLGSNKNVWWKCKKGHEWRAPVARRTKGVGCPYCANQKVCKDNCLATVNPKLSRQWHPTLNKNLTSKNVTLGSSRKIWWKCKKSHEWQATPKDRKNGSGCPYCANQKVCKDNCLATVNPKLAKEWHPEKNGIMMPKHVFPGSLRKVWWKCKKGHEWHANINSRNRGSGCPHCRYKDTFEPLKSEKMLGRFSEKHLI